MRILRALFLSSLLIGTTYSQQVIGPGRGQNPQREQAEDVVRVKTELVQTDITVLDKRGKVARGLSADDFELHVDNKLQALSFFEEVAAGSVEEEKQLTAAGKGTASRSGKAPGTSPGNSRGTTPGTSAGTSDLESYRGRVIFFFVDDVHLTAEGLKRARSVVTHFVETRMTAKDRVAVVSTSGQIGFLQQLTENKAVLREAISRLNYKYNPETTASQVSISEVDANLVANHSDRGLFAYLVDATMKEFQTDPVNARAIVVNRVRQINSQSRIAEVDTLSRLRSLMRSSTPLLGRKILFFISDGFVVDAKRSNGEEIMRQVTNEAARVGVVIYSLDTRSNGPLSSTDASKRDYPDFSSRTAGRSVTEERMPQDPLVTLADETGGRTYLNPNVLDEAVTEALTESSNYYLLAWRPDTETQRAGKSRIKVVIKGRPDLRVRMRRRFIDSSATQLAAIKNENAPANSPDGDLTAALASLYPRRDLPASVSASVVKTPDKGTVLNLLMQIDGANLGIDESGGKDQAIVDVMGIALDDRGRFVSFKQKIDVPREVLLDKDRRFIKWSRALPLPAGLYQVRVAFRDRQSARTGSAMAWIEIP